MLIIGNYHYIRNDFTKPHKSIFGVTPNNFKNQLKVLKENGKIINPNDLLNNYEDIVLSKDNNYLVTFDDGLKEQYDLALPILDELDASALFFINSINYIEKKVSLVHKIHLVRSEVSSELILNQINQTIKNISLTKSESEKAVNHYKYDDSDTAKLKYLLNFKIQKSELENIIDFIFKDYFNEDEIVNDLYMNKDQLKDLAKRNYIGNHTHSHLALGNLNKEEIHQEILKTKQFIESLGYGDHPFISYPYGSEDACKNPVPQIAKDLNYQIGLTMFRGGNTGKENKLLLKRYACNDLIGYNKI